MNHEKTHWDQTHYGKLVKETNGSIKDGFEHQMTGHSAIDDKNIRKLCYPHKAGIGANDLVDWSRHPWAQTRQEDHPYNGQWDEKGGGFAVMPKCSEDGKWHIVAVKLRGRSEGGIDSTTGTDFEGPRSYVEAHHLIHEAEAIKDLPLYNLMDNLHTRPLTERNNNLPKVEIATEPPQLLPDNWFDEVKPLLKKVLSGQSYSETGRQLEKRDEFYQRARLALACLPETLRWRLPIAAGAVQVELHIAFGHGVSRAQGLEKITTSSTIEQQTERVLYQIENAVAGKKTLGEVCEAIDSHFADYNQPRFQGETLPAFPDDTQQNEKIGKWWKNSMNRFRSEVCGERWVEPVEPARPAEPEEFPRNRAPEPPTKGWIRKMFGRAVVAAAAATSGEGRADELPEKPTVQKAWTQRADPKTDSPSIHLRH